MDVPVIHSTQVPVEPQVPLQRPVPGVITAMRALPRRRRPTGAAPPLPYHLQTSGIWWLVAAGVLLASAVAVFSGGVQGFAVAVTVVDNAIVSWLAGLRLPGLMTVFQLFAHIGSWLTIGILWWTLVVALLVLRRLRHLIVLVVATELVIPIATVGLGSLAQRPRPFGVVIQTDWGGWALPSVQMVALATTLVGALYTLVPEGRWRNIGKWVAAGLIVLASAARVALGAENVTDLLVGVALGVTLPLLAFRVFCPNETFPIRYRRGRSAHLDVTGARGAAIRRGLADQLGLVVDEVRPFGLAGSAGSTPLRITVKGDPPTYLFGKLYAKSHLRADRWYKLSRELLYGRLEDEKPFNAVRRLVQQEDYALALMQRAGLPAPAPLGFVELTPEREYLLVTEFFDGSVELGEAEVDDSIIDDGIGIVRKLWDAGLAHRDIKPANLLIRNGRMLLIDVAFAETRPSPWRQAVDLANMMLCLALRSDPQRVYQITLRQFSVAEITEAFAAARGLALPSQLRSMLRAKGRDLHAEFVQLLPTPPRPIMTQRWSARRMMLWAMILLLLVLLGRNVGGLYNEWLGGGLVNRTSLHIDALDCDGPPEPLWLQAQAVPSASLIPCVRALPTGWTLGDVAVNNGRSVITFDHDRAGENAVEARLTARCNPAGAAQTPPGQPDVRRYKHTEQNPNAFSAIWHDQFPGGCLTYRLHSATDRDGNFASEAASIFDFTPRPTLEQTLHIRSGGRLHLNPTPSR